MAELIKHHIPKIVEIHNYSAASSATQKNYNWVTLNRIIFRVINLKFMNREGI
jgi:hypothetical protein